MCYQQWKLSKNINALIVEPPKEKNKYLKAYIPSKPYKEEGYEKYSVVEENSKPELGESFSDKDTRKVVDILKNKRLTDLPVSAFTKLLSEMLTTFKEEPANPNDPIFQHSLESTTSFNLPDSFMEEKHVVLDIPIILENRTEVKQATEDIFMVAIFGINKSDIIK